MTRRFPLFSLPNLALHHRVFRNFTWDILFNLSLCSTKSKEIVRKYTKYLNKERKGTILVHIYDSYSDACLTNFCDTCTWMVSSTRSIDAWNWEEHVKPRNLNGFELRVGRVAQQELSEFERCFGCVGDPPQIVLMALVDYLVDVLNCQVSRLTVDTDSVSDLDALLNWKSFEEASSVSWHNGSVTPQEMTRLFDLARNKKNLSLTVNCAQFEYGGSISVHTFYASNMKWFNGNYLLKLDCQHCGFYNPPFTQQDYNAAIKKWMDGGLKKLISLRVFLEMEDIKEPTVDHFDIDQILEGIDSYPGVAKRYDPTYDFHTSGAHYAAGRDIVRKDGEMATLLIERNSNLHFAVWKQRNPDERNDYHNFHNLFKV